METIDKAYTDNEPKVGIRTWIDTAIAIQVKLYDEIPEKDECAQLECANRRFYD